MVQWSGICLPKQETWFRSLIREDTTCWGATKPMCQLLSLCSRAPESPQQKAAYSRAGALQQEKPQGEAFTPQLESSPCLPWLKKACTQPTDKDRAQPEINKEMKIFKREIVLETQPGESRWFGPGDGREGASRHSRSLAVRLSVLRLNFCFYIIVLHSEKTYLFLFSQIGYLLFKLPNRVPRTQ